MSRDVQQGPSWFVRLDSYQTTHSSARYDHPVSWKAEDLSAILSRLLLEERVGIMDDAKPARPVFSWEEVALIQGAARQAFQEASPAEWIAFLLLQPRGEETGVTSGGLFVESQRLHVVIANRQTIVGRNSEELARVRANPFYAISGSGGAVSFEPRQFGLATKANWSGGHRASASELVLDHTGFLSHLRNTASLEAPIRAASPSSQHIQMDQQPFPDDAADPCAPPDQATVRRLQTEIERLKKQLAEKDLEIDRLKAESLRSRPKP